jgi:PelA/Pel-15E family pectate lyase
MLPVAEWGAVQRREGYQVIKRRTSAFAVLVVLVSISAHSAETVPTKRVLQTMKRATQFMIHKVSRSGGYVWYYLPDFSRRWGEMEARPSMIWIQAPGTSSMGHLFLDAYHATGDALYYAAAEAVAAALVRGQLPSGGWNYVVDFAGTDSLREWYATIGRNGWRLEEFQHYSDNGTFDDQVTSEAAKFLLRLYVEKHDARYRPALDKAIAFVLKSQYEVGGWPQRYPTRAAGAPSYSAYLTFNDEVTAENIDFLILCYQVLGDERLLAPIKRGMQFFVSSQQAPPQAGWALQYTLDLEPAGARTYEPKALVTDQTARNIGHLIRFYRLTGESRFLAGIPAALTWLESTRAPPEWNIRRGTHPTFVELDTNKPLFVHRSGSNVINGRYYVDYDHQATLAHYSAFRAIDIAALQAQYEAARALSPAEAVRDSPLETRHGSGFPPYFTTPATLTPADAQSRLRDVLESLNAEGYWPAPLSYTSHPYRGDGARTIAAGDFRSTYVGDESDTSPYPDPAPRLGISTAAYIENMNVLIAVIRASAASNPPAQPAAGK